MDFDIRLGDSVCVPVSLTDNQVDCRLSANKPNKHVSDTFCHGDTLSLQASSTVIINNSFMNVIKFKKC